ncbi:MAG: substrate-binding domain-containing protein [Bacteroidetes bacterium]|nr:substrate-binding domain-containing protein [Bacteroidota bacterium]
MKKILLFLSLIFLLLSSGCKNKNASDKYTDTPTTGDATIAVDETFKPLIEAELPVFHAVYKYALIHPKYLPEVDALNLLLKDSVRLAIVSRPLSKKEMDYFHSKKFFPREVRLALDGIAIILNPKNPDTLLSVETIKKILLGELTNWNQINKKSKLGKIKVVFDNPNSSTVRYMVDSVTKTGKLGDQLSALKYNLDVVDFVSRNPETIGLIGVNWVSDRDDPKCLTFLSKIKVAAISREAIPTPDNSYQPYQAYLATNQYPFSRYIYALISEPRAGLGSGFTSFVASDKGQRIIQKTGVLPITQPMRLVKITN